MDAGIVASQLQTHKIRQGPIYKRTKFLQEWQERWAVLTMNFFFIFANKGLKQVTDFIDLRDVLSYKSYLRKDDDMIPAGWKITTHEEMYYFCARNCNEKWSWIVSLERLMDFKYTGKSPYNNIEWISTRGFMSQGQFERGKFDERVDSKPKEPEKPKTEPKIEDKGKPEEKDLQKLKKELDQLSRKLSLKQQEVLRRQKEQEQLFILQLNKLKKAQQALKQIQAQVQLKVREAQKVLSERPQQQKEIIVEKTIEVIVEKIIQKPIQVIIEKPVIVEKSIQKESEKKENESKKEQVDSTSPPTIAKKESTPGQRVSEMKKLYESKMDTGKYPLNSSKSITSQKSKEESKTKEEFLHLCRDKIIVSFFEEFHSKAYTYGGLRPIVEFIIKICSQRSLGYQQYFIREAKSHENRFVFAEVFLELITNNKDYSISKSLSKLVQVLIFEAPGIFKLNHFDIIKRKMSDLLLNSTEETDLAVILKTMYVVHKVKKYEKDAAIHQKLKSIESLKSQEAKNWARKLIEDI